MTLRQKLACVGLTVFGLQIASAAAGGALLTGGLAPGSYTPPSLPKRDLVEVFVGTHCFTTQ